MTLADLHQGWAWVVVVGNAAAGVWALGAHRWPALRVRALWWFTAAAQIAIFVEVALGVALMSSSDVEPPELHEFYGFVALITVGIIYSYRNQMRNRLHLLYGGGGLFLMGLGLRAMSLSGS